MRKNPVLVVLLFASALGAIFFVLLFAAHLLSGKRASAPLAAVGSDRVALVKVEGMLVASEKVVEELNDFAEDSSIKAIVVRVDSPGGGVVASQEIYDAIRSAKKEHKKKVVVSMGSVAASGGYYIAAAADKIVANPGTLTGSIGVKMEFANVEKLLEKVGVKGTVVKSGEYKDVGSPFRDMTDKEKQLLQGVIDDVHSQFIEAVSEGRNIPVADVRAIADGRIFTGRQAKSLKLVDRMGDLSESIKLAAELSGIKGKPNVITRERRMPFFDYLREETSSWIVNIVKDVIHSATGGDAAQFKYLYRQ